MAKRRKPTPADWHAEALDFLRAYQARHLQAFCSLPDLYVNIVARHEVSIGQFHDGIRTMVTAGQVRLHPFSGSRFALEREEYALVAEREIMYYVEAIQAPG